MFDIRASVYATEVDRPGRDFWNTHQRVIASLETLRADTKERHQRLIESDAWDLVIVDEAHRLGADEKTGATLAYGLLERLLQHELVKSMLFFTGTPHRGKNYGFLALLQLLRPDLFDPERPPGQQLPKLREVMIRNNKHTVTDLQGKLLFHPPDIEPRTYAYSPDEARFYDMLTEFISSGKAYASTLGGFNGRAVMLVLVSMQKLASSSVAAIRRALKGRLARVGDADFAREKLEMLKEALAKLELSRSEGEEDDLASGLDEQVSAQSAQLALMGDERDRLVELVAAADAVVSETKIQAIVDFVAALPAERSVLFFTEYKATQALLMSALLARFGEGCVTFINGDGRIEGVRGRDKRELSRSEDRASAADRFNAGRVRFLVSTEAGGEGIDLQQSCFTLVHVDLPWNPMRLHQRVGRLNRYGQHQTVKVTLFRNPDTVEGRIWDLLNEKLQRINGALRGAMDEPEDMLQLVLGMTSPALFQELYADAPRRLRAGWMIGSIRRRRAWAVGMCSTPSVTLWGFRSNSTSAKPRPICRAWTWLIYARSFLIP